jgi:hypothetical protein
MNDDVRMRFTLAQAQLMQRAVLHTLSTWMNMSGPPLDHTGVLALAAVAVKLEDALARAGRNGPT